MHRPGHLTAVVCIKHDGGFYAFIFEFGFGERVQIDFGLSLRAHFQSAIHHFVAQFNSHACQQILPCIGLKKFVRHKNLLDFSLFTGLHFLPFFGFHLISKVQLGHIIRDTAGIKAPIVAHGHHTGINFREVNQEGPMGYIGASMGVGGQSPELVHRNAQGIAHGIAIIQGIDSH